MCICEHDIFCDFAEVRKIVEAGVTSKLVTDYELSRYACYLIVQNGDPRKELIVLGQTYFTIGIVLSKKYWKIEHKYVGKSNIW